MATVGDLVVNLSTNSKNFTKGMQGATKQVTTFGSVVEKSVKVGAVAAMAAVSGAVGAVVIKMKELDSIAKTAGKTGFGVDTITALGLAAKFAGEDTEAVNDALKDFTIRSGDAMSAGGALIPVLEDMGIPLEEFNKLNPEEKLGVIADSIQGLGTQSEQTATAVKVFGESGAKLVNIFNKGSEGLQKFTDEAADLGLAFSADELRAVEDANDSITRLTTRIGALASVFTVKIAPAIEIVVSALESLQVTADSVIDKLGGGLQGALNAIMPQAGAVFGAASIALKAKSFELAEQRAKKNMRFPAGTDFSIPKDNKAEEKEANAILKEIRDQQKNNPGLFISLQGGV
jgi:hypothetical protein